MNIKGLRVFSLDPGCSAVYFTCHIPCSRVARSEIQSNPNYVLHRSRLLQMRKRGHKTIAFIETKKRLGGFLKMVVYYQQCEFKELTEKAARESAMQPKLWNTKDSIEKSLS